MMKIKILKALRQGNDYVSGQELCEQLHVSRTAVWKTIRQLQEEGYQIEALQNKGYRLVALPDTLSVHEILSNRRTKWLGNKIYYYEEIDSTNSAAKRLAEEGAPHGTVVTADSQVAGRGRRGRQWSSPKGCGLWFTLILKPEIEPGKASMLTLVMAMAVVKGIVLLTGSSAGIKWPNDVVVNKKKVCGILTEMSAQVDYINYLVIGTGINVFNQEFEPELKEKATSLHLEHIDDIRRGDLLEAVMEEFERYYECYLKTQDISLFMEEYNQYLVNKDSEVQVLDPEGSYMAKAIGVNEIGELLVEKDKELIRINSGEVSVRGIYGYVS